MTDNPQTTKHGYLGNHVHETFLVSGKKKKFSEMGEGIMGVVFVYYQPQGGKPNAVEWESK